MIITQIKEELAEANPQALFANGFEDAIIGYTINTYTNHVAVYSAAKCVKILLDQGLSEQEAEEYLEFNTYCAYMGPHSPLFMRGIS